MYVYHAPPPLPVVPLVWFHVCNHTSPHHCYSRYMQVIGHLEPTNNLGSLSASQIWILQICYLIVIFKYNKDLDTVNCGVLLR